MSESFRVTVFERHREVHSEEYSESVELGRQDMVDVGVYCARPLKEGRIRIPIARKDEITMSKRQAIVEALTEGMVRVTNPSETVSIRLLTDKSELRPISCRDLPLPQTLLIGAREVHIADPGLESLPQAPLPPGWKADRSLLGNIAADRTPEVDALIPWFQAIMDVDRATTELDCYDRATSALVNVLGLDSGRVLLLVGGNWHVKAQTNRPDLTVAASPRKPSTRALRQLMDQRKTVWRKVSDSAHMQSLVGVEDFIAAPILDRQGNLIGALYGDRGEGVGLQLITELEAMLVQLLASGVAAGLARKELLQKKRELEIGCEIQGHFLPRELPQAQGWKVAAHFRPAREVSGDFYDVFALPRGQMAVVIADVCDKGVGSALYMALFRSLLRAFAEQAVDSEPTGPSVQPALTPGPAVTEPHGTVLARRITKCAVEQTNNYVALNHGWHCMFCTLFFGVLDTASGVLTYINAGHEAPALLGANGIKSRLSPNSPVVGINPHNGYEINCVHLEPGDTLFAYTDGITEARDGAGNFFAEKRLLSLLETPAGTVTALVDNVLASLHVHVGGAEPHDDVTMLAVRRLP